MIESSTRLRRAVLLGDVALVQRLIRTRPSLLLNPDFEDKANTSLHLAAKHGHSNIAAILIAAGHDQADISWNADHETPLMLATRHGQVGTATLLVKAFPHCVPLANKDGLDALALSCQHQESTELVPILLSLADYPALPNAKDHEGNTPLHHASASGSLKALRILLAAGSNPLAKNNHDWTPLQYSISVASEVYFRNLVAEFERKKVEGAKLADEQARQRAAGLRMIETEQQHDPEKIGIALSEDEVVPSESWSSSPQRSHHRPAVPVNSSIRRHEWVTNTRSRAGSGD